VTSEHRERTPFTIMCVYLCVCARAFVCLWGGAGVGMCVHVCVYVFVLTKNTHTHFRLL